MIQVFCNKRGSGKTKRLIELANSKLTTSKGDSIYIDEKTNNIIQIDRKIRFISTDEFNISNCDSFYGLICGIISENYDIENIYVDSLLSILSCEIIETYDLFKKLYELINIFNINLFINIDFERSEIPKFIEEYLNWNWKRLLISVYSEEKTAV